jgi:hypothetical protein
MVKSATSLPNRGKKYTAKCIKLESWITITDKKSIVVPLCMNMSSESNMRNYVAQVPTHFEHIISHLRPLSVERDANNLFNTMLFTSQSKIVYKNHHYVQFTVILEYCKIWHIRHHVVLTILLSHCTQDNFIYKCKFCKHPICKCKDTLRALSS